MTLRTIKFKINKLYRKIKGLFGFCKHSFAWLIKNHIANSKICLYCDKEIIVEDLIDKINEAGSRGIKVNIDG